MPDFDDTQNQKESEEIVEEAKEKIKLDITPEEIAEREGFYGNMIWLFDATHRFLFQASGDRVFFSFGQQEAGHHIAACKKPVFLDFGSLLVEAETFTNKLSRITGFGLSRSREWFRSRFLSSVLAPSGARPPQQREYVSFHHWKGKKCPFDRMLFPTKWRNATNETEVTYPSAEKYFSLNYHWVNRRTRAKTHVQQCVIESMPQLANGWTLNEIELIGEWLRADVVIIGGLLRLMPAPADALKPFATEKSAAEVIAQIQGHIAAGRIPLLKPSTLQTISDLVRPKDRGVPRKAVDTSRKPLNGDGWLFT